MAVAGIHISLSADSKGFRSELTKARREINGFSDRSRASFKRFSGDSTRSLNRVQSSFRNTGTAATTLQAALRPLLALFTVAAFTAFVKGAFDAASAIKAAAGAAGLCAVELQKWQYALQGTGVAVSETDRALRTFGVRLGQFKQGAGPAVEVFQRLGIASRITSGELSSAEAVLRETIGALSEISDPATRAAESARLFGEELGPKLAQLLATGRAAIEAELAAAETISNHLVNRSEELQSRWDQMLSNMRTKFQSFVLGIADLTADLFAGDFVAPEIEIAAVEERIAQLRAALENLRSQGEGPGGFRFTATKAELDELIAKAGQLRKAIERRHPLPAPALPAPVELELPSVELPTIEVPPIKPASLVQVESVHRPDAVLSGYIDQLEINSQGLL